MIYALIHCLNVKTNQLQADPKQASSAPQETESQLSGSLKRVLLTTQQALRQPKIAQGSLKSALLTAQNRQESILENNYTENNYQENIYPQSISYDETIEDENTNIKSRYDVLSERDHGGVLDEIVSLIADTLCADAPSVRIAGRQVPIETVRSRFAKLTAEHIEYVIKTLGTNVVNVRNMRAC